MGGCHGKIFSKTTKIPVSQSSHDSECTIVGNDHHLHDRNKIVNNTVEMEPMPDYDLPVSFGKALREKYFSFDPEYHNLNHSSYGTIPKHIQSKLHHYQALHERRPDHFIRYTYPPLLDANRAAAASLLNAPLEDVVLVPNATTGINTILRGFPPSFWSAKGKDEILYFGTIYDACGKTVAYIRDSTQGRVQGRSIALTYPISNAAIVQKFKNTVNHATKVEGKRPRIAIFDTVSSVPGVRFPYEQLVAACRELGILSLVDGAQGIGMLDLNLERLDPDFFTSNCHKWLFVPRACAVLYVPKRNQHLVRSTLPTSHLYVPDDSFSPDVAILPSSSDGDEGKEKKGDFAELFAYVGTLDNSPYLCVKDAIEWREKVLGGEDRIHDYCTRLAQEGGAKVAEILGTWVMQNEEGTLIDCFMVNVAMPLIVVPPTDEDLETGTKAMVDGRNLEVDKGAAGGKNQGEALIPYKEAQRVWEWMTKVLVEEYQTFIPVYYHAGRFWARLSAQVYLDMEDFEWTGKTLKELSARVARKEYDP